MPEFIEGVRKLLSFFAIIYSMYLERRKLLSIKVVRRKLDAVV
ncbi:hypothetical protein MIDIC_330004 [Alphaproteobacteria bacterium]